MNHILIRFISTSNSTFSILLLMCLIKARKKQLALTMAAYLEGSEVNLPPVSIRVTVSVQLTKEDIVESSRKFDDTWKTIFGERERVADVK